MNLKVTLTKNLFNGFFVLFILLTVHTVRAQTEGIDAGFNPVLTKNEVKASVETLVAQTDNKIVVSGDFDKINGVIRNRIARLNADGSVDASFNPGSGFDVAPTVLFVQTDGKILAGGSFSSYNGTARANLIRINADGSLDAGFTATTDQPVKAIYVTLAGSRIYIGGGFTTVNGAARPALARLNVDGTTDATFNVSVSITGTINSIVEEDSRRIVVGGSFSVNANFRVNLIRIDQFGTFDSIFNAGNIATVKAIVALPDREYLVIVGDSVLERLLNFGGKDPEFQTATVTGSLNTVVSQSSRDIILGGAFTAINGYPQKNIARLRVNGALERGFIPSGANGEVKALFAQSDGKKTLVGGNFSMIGGVERTGIARINSIPSIGGNTYFDFDGDSRADFAVYRPSNGFWYILMSGNGTLRAVKIGLAENSDTPVPADYNGDGTTDPAVWRPANGGFYIDLPDNRLTVTQFGKPGDDPLITGDWNGDGRNDVAVYREAATAGTQSVFFIGVINSRNFATIGWGTAGDRPVRGDFDGDKKLDAAVFRPSDGTWYTLNSASNTLAVTQFGVASDRTVAADYDGDGSTDIAVYRPSDGVWYRLNSSNGQFVATKFGAGSDKPVPADYDGDGRADISVYRPESGVWYQLGSTSGFSAAQFGIASDIPIPNIFVR